MELQIIPQLRYVTGQKNHLEMRVHATNTSFMELVHIAAWSFLPQECIVKIDVYIAGDLWNSMIHWQWNQKELQNQKKLCRS